VSISPDQVKTARGLLGWSIPVLAGKAGLSVTTVASFEKGTRRPSVLNVSTIRKFFDCGRGIWGRRAWRQTTEYEMSAKPTRTREELAALITEWLRGRPECASVTGVAVAPMVRISDDSPNWHAAFAIADGGSVPQTALRFVDEVTTQFDLAG
jgi:transcriptional regulator with XRE-family HTH domain